ncbi:hypothetical protein EMN47_16715 [Prolixibacteraceae bacterium JC049]|nr:hypothetical protein [Prolixibacteraceae bacterium JC049]
MISYIILSFFALLFLTISYYGAFKALHIETEHQGGETIVYKKATGHYQQTGKVMNEVYYMLLKQYNIETFKGYARYLDNPKKVEKAKLRSEVGSVVENKDLEKLTNLDSILHIDTIKPQTYITTTFPYKGKISVIMGILKVYAALNKHAAQNGSNSDGAITEIYDIPNKRIIYRKEID